MTTLLELELQKLAARIPQIINAANRAQIPVADCHVYDVMGDPNRMAVAAPPPMDDSGWHAISLNDPIGSEQLAELLNWGVQPDGGSIHWVRAVLPIPEGWAGRDEQSISIALGRPSDSSNRFPGLQHTEGIGYWNDAAVMGFDYYHPQFRLNDQIIADNGRTPFLIRLLIQKRQPFVGLWLNLRDDRIYRLGVWMKSALEAAAQFHETDRARHLLRDRVNKAYNMLDLREGWNSDRFAESAYAAYEWFTAHLADDLNASNAPKLTVTGHAHLDTAWLWPLWRTRQKAIHTTASALHLMQYYPEYMFSMSQSQIYKYIEEDDLDLFDRIKEHIDAGRFEPVGIGWVEPDCNIPSGESLIRQFQHGLQHFKQFGDKQHVLWLPDVFGYSAALPQILRGFGIDVFVTSKISWNQFNRMPFDTFKWRGIDGSEVLTHFITTSAAPVGNPNEPQWYTYNGEVSAADVNGAWAHYQNKVLNDELLYLAGWGDGGGGPTEDMLETRRALAAIPGFPKPEFGSVETYFKDLYARVWESEHLPKWVGELYLEYHRGTYTSQARTKQNNRKAELRLREVQWLNAWARLLGQAEDYQPEMDSLWEVVLLNQFHDILPGSSIAQVYKDSEKQFAALFARLDEIESLILPTITAYTGSAVINSLNRVDYLDFARIPLALAPDHILPSGKRLSQVTEENNEQYLLLPVKQTSFGYRSLQVLSLRDKETSTAEYKDDDTLVFPTGLKIDETQRTMETEWYRVTFDEQGAISSLLDVPEKRELVAPGRTLNQFVCYEDKPLNFEAWDIDAYYLEKPYPVDHLVSFRAVEHGPVRVAFEITHEFGKSRIVQRVSINYDHRIEFQTRVDWDERDTLLKVLFPFNLNADKATCEIQFGSVERPTHRNTSWDVARFEVSAHKWVDVSEGVYGITLMNDGKYGHSFNGAEVGLSLLKSAKHPDPEADRGTHEFSYALALHAWHSTNATSGAYRFNVPVRYVHSEEQGKAINQSSESFLAIDDGEIVIDTVKTAQLPDGSVSWIIRMYEAINHHTLNELLVGRPITRAAQLDLMENEIAPLEVTGDNNQIRLTFRPFEIKTIQIWFA